MAPDAQSQESAPRSAPDSSPQNSTAQSDSPRAGESPAAAMRDIWARLAELRTYVGDLIALKIDRVKLTIRQLLVLAALGVLAVLAAAGTIITAIVLLLAGIAGALAEICGQRPWLGNLLCGALVLCIVAAGIWIALKRIDSMSREMTVKKYESRQQSSSAAGEK